MSKDNTVFVFTTRYLPGAADHDNFLFNSKNSKRVLSGYHLCNYLFRKAPEKYLIPYPDTAKVNETEFWKAVHQFSMKHDEFYAKSRKNRFNEDIPREEKIKLLRLQMDNSEEWVMFLRAFDLPDLEYPIYQIEGELIFACRERELRWPELQKDFIIALIGDVFSLISERQTKEIEHLKLILHGKELGARADDQIIRKKSLIDCIQETWGEKTGKVFIPINDKAYPGPANTIQVELFAFKHTPGGFVNRMLKNIDITTTQEQPIGDLLLKKLQEHPQKN